MGLLSSALVSSVQLAISSFPNLQGTRGLIYITVDQNLSYKLKVNEFVHLTTSGFCVPVFWVLVQQHVEWPEVLGNS